MNSSFLLLYFFNLLFFFSFFFFFFSFLSPPLFFIFLRVIYYGFTPFPPSTCGSSIGSPFFLFPLPLLESSILSWKAARLLFRHHFHINAARKLAGRHLMRRGQYPKIFVPVHYYLLFDIFPFRFAVGFVRGVILND